MLSNLSMVGFMQNRVVVSILGLVALIFGPWWLVIGIGVWGALMFPHYIEILIYGFLLDVLFQGSGMLFLDIPWRHTLIVVVFFVIAMWLRPLLFQGD
ncbi:MAG: hypothetical protein ACI83D_000267 [Planctomycetota bacterium]|jgi:hypothetical protein